MSQQIPGGDSVKVGYGHWHGHLTGNDTVDFTQAAAFTLTGGSGNDRILALTHTAMIHLGDGNDTIAMTDPGDATVHLGNGRDFVSLGDGVNSVQVGSGADTIHVNSGQSTIVAGGGNDLIKAQSGTAFI